MKKKNLYFVQPNTLLGNSIYFPYAVGVLASYALQFEDINQSYELAGIIFKEDSQEQVFDCVKDPFIVGFSNYFWNYKYNLDTAKTIKETDTYAYHIRANETEQQILNDDTTTTPLMQGYTSLRVAYSRR